MSRKHRQPKATRNKFGQFSGEPKTLWLTEEPGADRKMQLIEPFSYRDPKDKPWAVEAGYKVDGASIPRALWSLVGSPYTGDYRRASIVHDKACDGADEAQRRAADRMFFHACRCGGCSWVEAMALYIGVRIGANLPKVAAWRTSSGAREQPDFRRSATDERIEADFRLMFEQIFEQGEPGDALTLQRRVDSALSLVAGI